MMKLVKVFIAMMALAAFLVAPSVASAISPTLGETTEDGTTHLVPVGTKVIATNVEHAGTVKTTVWKSNLGNLECETATWTGTVTKNSGGSVTVEIETADYRGDPSNPGIHCSGGFGGDITVTPSHTSALGLPWCLHFTAEDKFTVTGGKCSEATKALKFALHTATLGTCSYERSVATGPITGSYTTHPANAVLTIVGANAKFTKTAGSVFCPSAIENFVAFTLTTDETVGGVEKEGRALHIK
jgi:hypothetical protein